MGIFISADPAMGIFISADPAMDGLNWYAYCANNPMNYTDPWGLMTQQEAADAAEGNPGAWVAHEPITPPGPTETAPQNTPKTELGSGPAKPSPKTTGDGGPNHITGPRGGGGDSVSKHKDQKKEKTNAELVRKYLDLLLLTEKEVAKAHIEANHDLSEEEKNDWKSRIEKAYFVKSIELDLKFAEEFGTKPAPVLLVDPNETPGIAENIKNAQDKGHPIVLHYDPDLNRRRGRRKSSYGHKGPAGPMLSWDEYPFASTWEGGYGAEVKAVPRGEQNVQGGKIRGVTRGLENFDRYYVYVIDSRF